MKFTNLPEQPDNEQKEKWNKRMTGAERELSGRDSSLLCDYLRFLLASGMEPEDAVPMAIAMYRPALQEFLLFPSKS